MARLVGGKLWLAFLWALLSFLPIFSITTAATGYSSFMGHRAISHGHLPGTKLTDKQPNKASTPP